jgi:hypothetical protein
MLGEFPSSCRFHPSCRVLAQRTMGSLVTTREADGLLEGNWRKRLHEKKAIAAKRHKKRKINFRLRVPRLFAAKYQGGFKTPR